ncbi:MAG: hypothetical protein LBI02_01160 [Opitutaceae bacterium]|nr:hypothetical protein [Opitutaceae bacterium]
METFLATFSQAVEMLLDGMERPIQRAKKNEQPQALFEQEEKTHEQGDSHQPAPGLPDAEQTGREARQATL